jgi:hypothetical protein
MYHLKVDNLVKQRQRKEIRLQELDRKNHERLLKAINKEIQTNIEAEPTTFWETRNLLGFDNNVPRRSWRAASY